MRTAWASALGSSSGGRVQGAHHDALVGDAEADVARQVVGLEEGAQRAGQLGLVGDLAVAHDPGPEHLDRAAAQGHLPVDLHLGRGQVARLDLEADDGLGLLAGGGELDHGLVVGRRKRGLEGHCPPGSTRQVLDDAGAGVALDQVEGAGVVDDVGAGVAGLDAARAVDRHRPDRGRPVELDHGARQVRQVRGVDDAVEHLVPAQVERRAGPGGSARSRGRRRPSPSCGWRGA